MDTKEAVRFHILQLLDAYRDGNECAEQANLQVLEEVLLPDEFQLLLADPAALLAGFFYTWK